MSTTVSPETKLSRTLNKIQYCSSNSYSLKRELQQGMNNFYNTLTAFNKIAANKGAGTPGIDNETIDGINLKKLERYHREYVNNGYHPKPVKRTFIPKDNKKTRPLGIPTIQDRLIQKCLEQLLTPYFENIFSEWRIKDQVTQWLKQYLNLTVSKDKSKIVKASKGTRLLSYMIKVNPTNKTRERKTTKNSLNGQVQIQIPKVKATEYGYEYNWLKKGKVKHDETLAERDELEIIRTYKTIVRGIIQYFCWANNLSVLTHLNYLAEYSCLKTLARKRKTSIARVRKKCKIGSTWGISYYNKGETQYEPWNVYTWDKIKKMRNYKGNPDITINRFIFQGRTHLTDRLKVERCEHCDKTTQLQIHHIGTVRNAHRQSIMNKRTKVLCKDCHRKVTNQQIHDIRNKNNRNK
ncbi:group II intron reverse transcriptase/maturase [Candidatus Phytoplasma australasiaticum]